MENLKDGQQLSSYKEKLSTYDKILYFAGLLVLILFTSSLLNSCFNSLDKLYFHIDDYFLGSVMKIILKTTYVVFCLVYAINYTFWSRENLLVFYFKNNLIVNDYEEGEIEIPLKMIERILLYEKNSIIIKFHEDFFYNQKISARNKRSPLGHFIFTLDKKLIKIGPLLIDELNKKLK